MSGTTSTNASNATGQFQTGNGEIINPNGAVFYAKGINVYDFQMGDATQILEDFPGLNFVRLNCFSYQSPSAYAAFIQTMTSAGVVVELEDHTNSTGSNAGGATGTVFTGSQLSSELNWYSSIASAYASNPYVWFGTDNEPSETDSSGNNDPAALSAWQQETYNAIRGTGNNSPIMLEDQSNLVQSYYSGMTNTIWDDHYYGWESGYSTNQSTVSSTLASSISTIQQITSANGTMPVIVGEYGPSTDGVDTDANASQVLQAVQQSTAISGAVAWGYDAGANDNLTNGDGSLTSYGQEVAQWFASTPTVSTSSGSDPTPSANDTVVMAGSSAAITDASGNAWTVTATNTVNENGAAAGSTANVTELAYVNATIWAENTAAQWYDWTGSTWNGGSTTSPLPVASTPKPTPSPNDTVVMAGSTAAITDASGNAWTMTATNTVDDSGTAAGYTANVTELAYVNGAIWAENTTAQWYDWTGSTWNGGSTTSPLPTTPTPTPTPTPSPNDTVVKAGSTAEITDASGNTWTVTSTNTVDKNGAAAGYTANVTELAYVKGTIWAENTAAQWYDWTGSTWTGGSTTSPLPATPTPTPSPNDLMVIAGSTSAVTDASGNTWTITGGGQIAVNGTADTTTANVAELAYVNGTVWQENTGDLWWGKTSPTASWSPGAGTSTSPLPAPVTITPNSTSATVSRSEVSVAATSGTNMVLISGSNDIVSLSGGTNTVGDTGSGNIYILPAAGHRSVTFSSDILNIGDTLDLKPALAATNWSGSAATLANYLTVTDSSKGAVVSIAATSGGKGAMIASITGATGLNLSTLLAHSIT